MQLVQGGRWGAVLTQGRRHFALAAARLEGHAQLGVERAAHLRRGNNQRVSSAEEAGAEAVEEVQVVGGGAARLRVARPLEGRAHVVRPHRLCRHGAPSARGWHVETALLRPSGVRGPGRHTGRRPS